MLLSCSSIHLPPPDTFHLYPSLLSLSFSLSHTPSPFISRHVDLAYPPHPPSLTFLPPRATPSSYHRAHQSSVYFTFLLHDFFPHWHSTTPSPSPAVSVFVSQSVFQLASPSRQGLVFLSCFTAAPPPLPHPNLALPRCTPSHTSPPRLHFISG